MRTLRVQYAGAYTINVIIMRTSYSESHIVKRDFSLMIELHLTPKPEVRFLIWFSFELQSLSIRCHQVLIIDFRTKLKLRLVTYDRIMFINNSFPNTFLLSFP